MALAQNTQQSRMLMPTDKRKRSRVPSGQIAGKLLFPNAELPITLKNISLNGALVETEHSVSEQTHCVLVIPLSDEIIIKAKGHIVRSSQESTAMTFDEIAPESYPHLHRLVQLHAPEPDTIDEELVSPLK